MLCLLLYRRQTCMQQRRRSTILTMLCKKLSVSIPQDLSKWHCTQSRVEYIHEIQLLIFRMWFTVHICYLFMIRGQHYVQSHRKIRAWIIKCDNVYHWPVCYSCFINRTDRYCTKTTVINGVTIPKGAVIAIPIGLLQRSPLYWKDPEVFDPDR